MDAFGHFALDSGLEALDLGVRVFAQRGQLRVDFVRRHVVVLLLLNILTVRLLRIAIFMVMSKDL